MAYSDFDGLLPDQGVPPSSDAIRIEGPQVELPDASYVRDAALQRDGMDLVLEGPHGSVTIEDYFAAASPPDLVAPDGATLTPDLVNSFVRSAQVYAQAQSESDVSPVGAVSEISGEASVTRVDGSVEKIAQGTPIYQGDVIETASNGAVNVHFVDDTSFAVSGDARLAIDEYVYDPATQSGEQGFSVLKGLFVFTSGMIGRDDPDDVRIDTPTGSIGIRGTIIAGNATSGEITLIEGAIVVRDHAGNEVSLAAQFETAKIVAGDGVQNLGQIRAEDVSSRFSSISAVAPTLFSSIEEAAAEQDTKIPGQEDAAPADADASADQDGDNQVDGSAGTETETQTEMQETAPATNAPVEDAEPVLPPPDDGSQSLLGLDPFGSYSGLETLKPLSGGDSYNSLVDPYASLIVKPLPLSPLPPPPSEPLLTDKKDANLTTDGNLLPPPPPPPIATAADDPPVHIKTAFSGTPAIAQHNIAPEVYFQAAEGQPWSYNFAKEFINTDGPGDSLTYHLSAATQTALSNAVGTGSWNFNSSTGFLTIAVGTITANHNFNVEILAKDAAGQVNAGGFRTYGFAVFDGPNALPGGSGIDSTNLVYAGAGNNDDSETVGLFSLASGNKIFTGGGDDTVTISDGGGNIINLGYTTAFGSNSVTIGPGAGNIGNIVVGGDGKDVYNTAVAQNKFFGMGGDDKVVLGFSSGVMAGLNTSGNVGILMDLGDSGFKAGVQMANNTTLQAGGFNYKFGGNNTGYGDTLFLSGTGPQTLNFGAIDDHYLRGVERIDARSGGNVTISLSYQDVIEMTDYKNTLIFRANSGDNLNFTGFGASFVKVGNNVNMDDCYDGGASSTNFDIYSDGTVTLLVEDAGATVSGIPAL